MLLKLWFLILSLFITSFAICQTPEEQSAIKLMREGKNDEALIAFDKIVNANPRALHSMNAMAVIYYQKGDYTSSYNIASQGLKVDNSDPDLNVSVATAAIKVNKPEEALALMDQLVVKYPTSAMVHYTRAKALDSKNRLQEAIGAYTKAIQNDPDFHIAFYERGIDFLEIRRYDDALTDFTKYISTKPNFTKAYFKRGIVYFRLKNYNAAIADYNKILSVDAHNADGLTGRGIVYI